MGLIIKKGIEFSGGGGGNEVELTQAEYDALPESKLTDNVTYYIKDAQGGGGGASSADAVSYDNSESGLTATNVQGAVDEVNSAVEEVTGEVTTINGNISTINGEISSLNASLTNTNKILNTIETKTVIKSSAVSAGNVHCEKNGKLVIVTFNDIQPSAESPGHDTLFFSGLYRPSVVKTFLLHKTIGSAISNSISSRFRIDADGTIKLHYSGISKGDSSNQYYGQLIYFTND